MERKQAMRFSECKRGMLVRAVVGGPRLVILWSDSDDGCDQLPPEDIDTHKDRRRVYVAFWSEGEKTSLRQEPTFPCLLLPEDEYQRRNPDPSVARANAWIKVSARLESLLQQAENRLSSIGFPNPADDD
jgi:hypothetical protein